MLNYSESGNNFSSLCQTPIQLMQNHISASDRFTSCRKESKRNKKKNLKQKIKKLI